MRKGMIQPNTEQQNTEETSTIREQPNAEKEPNSKAIQEAELAEAGSNTGASTEEAQRPKRTITKPRYLRDFVE